jgi:competence protein ComGC
MMLVIVGIILAIIMIVIFFPATLKVGDAIYAFGCEGWTTLMNAIYEALGMPAATAAC